MRSCAGIWNVGPAVVVGRDLPLQQSILTGSAHVQGTAPASGVVRKTEYSGLGSAFAAKGIPKGASKHFKASNVGIIYKESLCGVLNGLALGRA